MIILMILCLANENYLIILERKDIYCSSRNSEFIRWIYTSFARLQNSKFILSTHFK